MEAGLWVSSQKIDLRLGDTQARKNRLVKAQFSFRFESSGRAVWINCFNNDGVARRVTLNFQGHSVYAAPSERDFYQLCMAVLYAVPKCLPEQIEVWFENYHY